jgi:septum formation protein
MIYLASKSPRRAELLRQIHVAFEPVDVDIPEQAAPGEAPEAYVRRVALEKARAGGRRLQSPEAAVLGADTAVVIDGAILGKPRDRDDALAMLARLSGRSHRVFSAVALTSGAGEDSAVSVSEVRFREIGADERQWYWDTGEPADKAEAYAIQGLGAVFVKHLSGSYSGVMGLPLYETGRLLAGR